MDFLSPFTYFAWENHKELIKANRAVFDYRPMTMATLFKHHEIKGPGLIAAKRKYVLKSCFRYALRNQIDFVPPEAHPFNPLYCLRISGLKTSGDQQFKIIDHFWKCIWKEGKVLDDPEVIMKELNSIGLDGETIIEKSFDREAKQEIKMNTKEALTHHAFGSPSFVCEDGELFWGNDSIKDLLEYLENGDQFDIELFNQRTSDINLN